MSGVPDDERRKDRRRDRDRRGGGRRDEPAPQRGRRQESKGDAHGEKGGGEFRLQHEPERDPDREKPARPAAPPQLDERRDAQRPEHDQGRVGRREHRARHHQRHRDPQQDSERRRFGRAEETPSDDGDERRECADQQERQRPDAELRAAENGGRGADENGDHRRMVEIAEGERTRPEGVIGFVEGELETPGGHGLQGQERDRSSDGESRQETGAGLREGPLIGDDGCVPHFVAFVSRRSIVRPPRTRAIEGQRPPA